MLVCSGRLALIGSVGGVLVGGGFGGRRVVLRGRFWREGFEFGVQGFALGVVRMMVVDHSDADSRIQGSFRAAYASSGRPSYALTELAQASEATAADGNDVRLAEEQLHLDPTRRGSFQSIGP